jgi:hypothetical protein
MPRLARALLLAVVTFCLVAPSASAAPTNLGKTLGNLWTTVLETPTPDNPFGRYEDLHRRVDNRVQHL